MGLEAGEGRWDAASFPQRSPCRSIWQTKWKSRNLGGHRFKQGPQGPWAFNQSQIGVLVNNR